MKKVSLFALLFIIVLTLTGCTTRPFVGAPGSEYVVKDNISYTYYNGTSFSKLFEFEFTKEFMFFEAPILGGFEFTAINNYQEISNEFIRFLDLYFDFKVEQRYLNDSVKNTISLSYGATERNYNTVKVDVDGEVYDVDAYLVLENGVNAIFIYTEFYSNGKLIIVPDYLYIYTTDIHEAYLKEFFPINNDYSSSKVVLSNYVTHAFPTPPRVVTESSYDDGFDFSDLLPDLGNHQKLSYDPTNSLPGIVEVCDVITTGCFPPEYSTLKVYVAEWELTDVIAFYETLYNGRYIEDDFVITSLGMNYRLVFGSIPFFSAFFDEGIDGNVLTIDVSVYPN